MSRLRVLACAAGVAVVFTSCGFFQSDLAAGRSDFAKAFTASGGRVEGVVVEDARTQTVAGHRYGVVRLRSAGLQQGGFDAVRLLLSGEMANAFDADARLEAIFVVLNTDGFPPSQATGFHREEIVGKTAPNGQETPG